MRIRARWGIGIAIGLAVLLAACGGGAEDREGPRPSLPTATVPTPVPTWTPSAVPPTWTPLPRTPPPTFTPRPRATLEAYPGTGSAVIDGALAVTLREIDANAAIAAAFAAQQVPALSAAPVIVLGEMARVRITLDYSNPLLAETGQVIAQGQFVAEGDRVRFVERRAVREQRGVLASETTLQAGFALVEDALTAAVRAQLSAEAQALPWARVLVYPGYLRVFLGAAE